LVSFKAFTNDDDNLLTDSMFGSLTDTEKIPFGELRTKINAIKFRQLQHFREDIKANKDKWAELETKVQTLEYMMLDINSENLRKKPVIDSISQLPGKLVLNKEFFTGDLYLISSVHWYYLHGENIIKLGTTSSKHWCELPKIDFEFQKRSIDRARVKFKMPGYN
jgi:hypothetical protein